MAGNNSIQFLRGTQSAISSSTQVALAGQPVYATDTNELFIGDGTTQIKNLIPVNTEGSYPTLGAGHLAKSIKIAAGADTIGWWKIGTLNVQDLENPSRSSSTIFLVNGLYAHNNPSGLLELNGRIEGGSINAAATTLNILSGNLKSSDHCIAIDGDIITLYGYLDGQYISEIYTVLQDSSEGMAQLNANLFNFDTEYYGTSAPSGAVYAVNRNLADYNSAGAALVDVASVQQISGAKIFVRGIKAANPASNSNSDDVATTKWVNDKGYVTLTDSQTITGDKTFTGNTSISNLTNSSNYKGLFYTTFIATFNNGTSHLTQGIAPKAAIFYICVPSTSNDGPFLARGSASSLYTESNYNGTVTCYAICY